MNKQGKSDNVDNNNHSLNWDAEEGQLLSYFFNSEDSNLYVNTNEQDNKKNGLIVKPNSFLPASNKETSPTFTHSKILPPPPRFPDAGNNTLALSNPVANGSLLMQNGARNSVDNDLNMFQDQNEQHVEWLKLMNELAANPSTIASTKSCKEPEITKMEVEDKRARRLARNRESARQSRRRKKELLESLSHKVGTLHKTMEMQRRTKINSSERKLNEQCKMLLLVEPCNLKYLITEIGPNCLLRRSIASFQYEKTLKTLLPIHVHFLLWLTSRPESFFLKSKDTNNKVSSRLSSRQIGEKIITHSNICNSDNFEMFWPLFCNEMHLSVDQEERMLQAYSRKKSSYSNSSQMQSLQKSILMLQNIKQGVLLHSQKLASERDTCFLHILNENQSIKFLSWYQINRETCRKLIFNRMRSRQKDSR